MAGFVQAPSVREEVQSTQFEITAEDTTKGKI